MADPVVEENHTPDIDPAHSFSSEFDFLPPPFVNSFYNSSSEQALLGNSIPDLSFSNDGDGDFDLTFDSVDDLYFPSENESFFIPVDATNRDMSGDFTPVFGGVAGDCSNDINNKNGVASTTSGYCNRESPTDSDCSGTAQSLSLSTQESVDRVAHVSEATITSLTSSKSGKLVVDQKLKVEEEATMYKTSITKRKNTSEESRNNKYRRRSEEDDVASVDEEDEDKRNARLIRNRESAQLSRQRKKHYVEELEDKLKNLQSIITDLNSKVSYFMAENATLRHKVGSGKGMCWPYHQPLPPSGMYPVPYPWMPFPAYMVKPKGSQVVPLLPIPRLKPQQSLAKVKKSEAKTKKVASVSVLGLLFCLFLFGALAPLVNVRYVEYDKLRGRVLDVSVDSSSSRAECERGSDQVGRNVSVLLGNGSELLVASLYVPRNEKLVKLDGNLIIRSVSESEKDMASGMCTEMFQFDVSSTSGAIIPASPATQQPKNTTNTHKGKSNRRILRGGLPVSDFNLTKDQNRATKPFPSMVVSVLVDPKEDSDGDIDGITGGTTTLSRVFIVVLVDGVKYVTYSCVLPRPEVPHLVTT